MKYKFVPSTTKRDETARLLLHIPPETFCQPPNVGFCLRALRPLCNCNIAMSACASPRHGWWQMASQHVIPSVQPFHAMAYPLSPAEMQQASHHALVARGAVCAASS